MVHPWGLAASKLIAANCKIAYFKTARLQDCMDYKAAKLQDCKTTWTARLHVARLQDYMDCKIT